MRNGVVASLLVIAMLAGAGAGYFIGSQRVAATTYTTFVSCPQSKPGPPLTAYTTGPPIGPIFRVEFSYQGPWNATVSTYSALATSPAYLLSSCHYGGSGTAYVYVVPPNPNGEQTVVGVAHKLDSSNGNLTVTVLYGAYPRSNSTTLPFGSAMTSVGTNVTSRGTSVGP
jgi:hypothetical protein